MPLFRTLFAELGFEPVLSSRTNRTLISAGIDQHGLRAVLPRSRWPTGTSATWWTRRWTTSSCPRWSTCRGPPRTSSTRTCVPTSSRCRSWPRRRWRMWTGRSTSCGRSCTSRAARVPGPRPGRDGPRPCELRPCWAGMPGVGRAGAAPSPRPLPRRTALPGALRPAAARSWRRSAPDDTALVIISRPYNGCDPGLNMNIPEKLRDLGCLAIPMDMLPLDGVDISADHPHMYWKYGQKILAAARLISQDRRLYPVYITNFGCGPDSFIMKYVGAELEGQAVPGAGSGRALGRRRRHHPVRGVPRQPEGRAGTGPAGSRNACAWASGITRPASTPGGRSTSPTWTTTATPWPRPCGPTASRPARCP